MSQVKKSIGDNKVVVDDTDNDDNTDRRFGIGRFKPEAIQCFATVGWFTASYSLASLMMSTIVVYVNSQITTLERQFGFSSKQTSLIMAANDIGFLMFVVIVAYSAKMVHIPRSLGVSTIIFGVSGLVCSLPHFLYGSTLNPDVSNDNNVTSLLMKEAASLRMNQSIFGQLCTLENRTAAICNIDKDGDNSDKSTLSVRDAAVSSLVIIVIGMLLQGFGKSPRASFSLVYIDDNTNRVKSGFYLGILIALSILGPAVAFTMGGIFSRIYVTLGETNLYPKHPRWIGAWWLGFLVFGGIALVVSLPLFCFPSKLPRKSWDKKHITKEGEKVEDVENTSHALIKKKKEITLNGNNNHNHNQYNNHRTYDHNNTEEKDIDKNKKDVGKKEENKSIKEKILHQAEMFFSSSMRLLANPVYVLMVCSKCAIIFMVGGQSAYSPKYLEQIFDLPAYKANYIMAVKTLAASCVGTFVGGYLTKYYKMTAKKALRFTVCTVSICVMLSLASLWTYCEQPETHNWPGSGECEADCHCEDNRYFPVCGSDGKTYYSPCFAGCVQHGEGTYTNCTCIEGGQATIGICPYGCDHVYYFAIVSGLRSLFGTLAIIPKVTVMIRTVEERDKALSLGISSFMASMLGWLAGPVIFGILIDGICILWDEKCGVTGRCLLYDNNIFRWKLNGLSSLGIGASLFFQLCALVYSWKTGCLDDIGVDGRKDELDEKKDKKKCVKKQEDEKKGEGDTMERDERVDEKKGEGDTMEREERVDEKKGEGDTMEREERVDEKKGEGDTMERDERVDENKGEGDTMEREERVDEKKGEGDTMEREERVDEKKGEGDTMEREERVDEKKGEGDTMEREEKVDEELELLIKTGERTRQLENMEEHENEKQDENRGLSLDDRVEKMKERMQKR